MDPCLQRLQQEIAALVDGLSPEQLSWHPPGKWCAAEVLEHLYLSYTGTVKGMERLLEAGAPQVSKKTLKNRVQVFAVISLGYFPEGRKSPKQAQPRGIPRELVQSDIEKQILAMDD